MTRSHAHAHSRATIPFVRVEGCYVPGYDTQRGRAARLILRALFAVYLATWIIAAVAWLMAAAGPRPMLISNISLQLICFLLIFVASRVDFEPHYRSEPPGVWPMIFFTYCLAIAVAVAFLWCAGGIRLN